MEEKAGLESGDFDVAVLLIVGRVVQLKNRLGKGAQHEIANILFFLILLLLLSCPALLDGLNGGGRAAATGCFWLG